MKSVWLQMTLCCNWNTSLVRKMINIFIIIKKGCFVWLTMGMRLFYKKDRVLCLVKFLNFSENSVWFKLINSSTIPPFGRRRTLSRFGRRRTLSRFLLSWAKTARNDLFVFLSRLDLLLLSAMEISAFCVVRSIWIVIWLWWQRHCRQQPQRWSDSLLLLDALLLVSLLLRLLLLSGFGSPWLRLFLFQDFLFFFFFLFYRNRLCCLIRHSSVRFYCFNSSLRSCVSVCFLSAFSFFFFFAGGVRFWQAQTWTQMTFGVLTLFLFSLFVGTIVVSRITRNGWTLSNCHC